MRPVTLYHYWYFGTAVRYLQDARHGTRVHGIGYVLESFEVVFERLKSHELRVSERTMAAERLEPLLEELRKAPEGAVLSEAQAHLLVVEMTNMRMTIEAELQSLVAYALSPKRHDTTKLIREPAALFAPDVFASLSEVCQYDLKEAARCIAFERPTAAAFHLMRATEETLRRFYCHTVRRKRCNPLLWYPMTQALQAHRTGKKNSTLLQHLLTGQ